MRIAAKCLAILAILLLPTPLFAQASLTGTVHDASGGVIPGVTVEASSPALIEKTRTAVTDATGQYRIIDLRPGTYSLTVTLVGLHHRETREHRADRFAGGHHSRRDARRRARGDHHGDQRIAGGGCADRPPRNRHAKPGHRTLPVARAAGALLNATPGINVDTNGSALSPTMTFFNANSSTINSTSVAGEGRMTINGFTVAAARSGGVSSYVYDTPNAEEVTVVVGGGLGESDIGGPVMNLIPSRAATCSAAAPS